MPISVSTMPAGRRFRPSLWPTLAAIVVIGATILLGNWQSRRADLRGALQQQAETMAKAAPLSIRRGPDVAADLRYRPATAAGEYVASRQVWLDNRTYKGAVGFRILTPLRLDDGSHLLVDRGWIAAARSGAGRSPPPVEPPTGRVTVTGRLNHAPPKFLELAHAEPTTQVVQNLDLADYARATGLTVAPLILEQAPGTSEGLIRDWPPPDLGRDKNVGYMWQWYGFATLTAVLWLVFSWRRA